MTSKSVLFAALQPPFRLLAFACVVLLACILPASHNGLSVPVAVFSLLAIAIAIGHGAFDGVLARPLLRLHFRRFWQLVFVVGYLAGMILVALLWLFSPCTALCAFLAYSAWHFGTESTGTHRTAFSALAAWCAGFVPIAAACLWHPASVSPIFASMMRSGSEPAAYLVRASGLLLFPCIFAILLGSVLFPAERKERILVTSLEILLFWRCEPLVAFAVFFCIWHTTEHLVASSTSHAGQLSLHRLSLQLRSGLLPWLASIGMLGVLVMVGARRLELYTAQLFLLISALTVPHMLLNELRRHRGKGIATHTGEAYAR